MFSLMRRSAIAAAGLLLVVAAPVRAQVHPGEVLRIESQGPSAADLGLYGLNTWDRTILGARARAMGGVFLAMPGDAASSVSNPAALAFMTAPELASESRYRMGSATGKSAPTTLRAPGGLGDFPMSDYRPQVSSGYTYNNLSYAMPLPLLGRKSGFGVSYRRIIDFKSGEEARFTVTSPFGEAEFGQGSDFSGGVDALTPAISLALNDMISLGAAINFMSGSLRQSGDQGVASFGFVVARGGVSFEQDVYGTALDFGAQFRLGHKLVLGGVLQTGHDLDFKNGVDTIQPLPDPTATDPVALLLVRNLMDHSLSVPTKYGAGVSYQLNDRISLGADYWNRAWSRAEITRREFTTTVLFPDSTNLLNHIAVITPGAGEVRKNAGLVDTHHFRLGAEWMVKNSPDGGVQIPLRIGFRREPFTFSNVDTASYNVLYESLVDAAGDQTVSGAERRAEVTSLINDLYQNGSLLLSGEDVPATTITLGSGFRVGAFSADLTLARTSYTVERIFLGAFSDFTRNLEVRTATEDRSITEFTFTTSLRF